MNLWRLVLKEILYRKSTFVLGLLAVIAAVGCLVGSLTLLNAHRLRTAATLGQMEEEAKQEAKDLEDDVRKITKKMGFNVLILPKDQDLHDVYADDFAAKTMPEEYVERLANANIATINHILPTLTRKLEWEEIRRKVILIGTRGQIATKHQEGKKPIMDPVPPKTAVLGHELARQLRVKTGDKVTFNGRELTVHKAFPARGNKDDITIWINLPEAQELLDQKGRINAILALECNCATIDRLAEIRAEIGTILPETQVIEFASQALARAEARNRAGEAAHARIEQERNSRAMIERDLESFGAVLVPVALLAAAALIGLLAWYNARARSAEIGTLRAIGYRTAQILWMFLGKALAMGLLGAGLGYLAGFYFSIAKSEGLDPRALFDPQVLALGLILAPLLALGASWLPAMLAAQQDPAVVLREE